MPFKINPKLGVVILAAGQGTRMKSATPKVLHPLAGKPLLKHVLEKAQKFALDENIFIVCGHDKEKLKEAFKNNKINWVYQDEQLGTAHALKQALPEIDSSKLDSLLVLYGDVPLVASDTLNSLFQNNKDKINLLTAITDNPFGLGRIVRKNSKVISIVEEKDSSDLEKNIKEINTGIAVYPASKISAWIDKVQNNNSQNEYYLTDVIKIAVEENNEINSIILGSDKFITVQGINSRYQLQHAEKYFQRKIAKELCDNGVSIADVDSIAVRGNIQTGIDNFIDVNNVFIGDIKLGNNCIIEPNCYLNNVVIGDNVVIRANSHLEHVVIESNCKIGPFARLRPDTIIKSNAHIGNFVEVKKSVIGEFSKVNHLSYVGDSIVGQKVNIGAGTITCNYDGVNKHQTIIKDGAFIGSNTALVAPITIEENATVGAGSTIAKLAPKDSLTVARSRQKTITSWKRPEKNNNKDK